MKNALAHTVRIRHRPGRSLGLLAIFMCGATLHGANSNSETLSTLSFEELSQIQVTTASKRSEPLANIAAAVTVLTGDEIGHSGANSLPDALRYIPGLDVSKITSWAFGVGARGFGGQYANQLLVMIDGRSIYEASFSGVLWQYQDTFFDDLDRIEVVRGPGGALWGSNAVNGVINILTKDSRDTQGSILYGGAGDLQKMEAGARQGFRWSNHSTGRIYVKHSQYNDTMEFPGLHDWERTMTGLRLDHHADTTHVTLQGDFTHVVFDNLMLIPTFTPPDYQNAVPLTTACNLANLLGRLTHTFEDGSTFMAQAYWDHMQQGRQGQPQRRNTFDLELQHNLRLFQRNGVSYGIGARHITDRIDKGAIFEIPGRETAHDYVINAFAQDEIALVPETCFLTLGAKIERNNYSGEEFQPNLRFRWQPAENHTLWAAVSRAVTIPQHVNSAGIFDSSVLPPGSLGPGSPATLVQIRGTVDQTEKLTSYELGYRLKPTRSTSLEIATFYNRYSDLLINRPAAPDFTSSPPTLPISSTNGPDGTTYGAELSAGWEPLSNGLWLLQATYTYFMSDVTEAGLGRDPGTGSPRHKATLRSTTHLGRNWVWDTGLRFVDRLEIYNVPSYLQLDLRLAWKPQTHWEIALVGQNLLDNRHPEHPPGRSLVQLEVPRSYYGRITWHY